MITVSSPGHARQTVTAWKQEGFGVGLVPTMGFLHEGHQSLIRRAGAENDKVVVSVFVNPMQFGPAEDFSAYPRDLGADAEICARLGADMLFHPEATALYPEGFCTFVDTDGPAKELCGKSRVSHFRGVCTVVAKLFHIIPAHKAYFGEKDAQQLAVIRRMAADLHFDLEIIGCPIVRHEDGLAQSSRNARLSPAERRAALALSRAVFEGERMAREGERSAAAVTERMREILRAEPLAEIEYVDAVDAANITRLDILKGRVLVAVAARIGGTRLIDNFMIDVG